MRTICKDVFKYEELSDKAKEKARDWYREGYDGQFEWEQIQDDAKEIGLRITSLDQHRANSGNFITTALECAEKIVANHGEICETYKTALAYINDRKALELDEDGEFVDQDKADELTEEFLDSLLEDYRILLEKDIEYQNSDEQVEEAIIANEYEFDIDGKRA